MMQELVEQWHASAPDAPMPHLEALAGVVIRGEQRLFIGGPDDAARWRLLRELEDIIERLDLNVWLRIDRGRRRPGETVYP